MPRTRHRSLACVTLLCCAVAAACSAKKPIVATGPAFHLVPSSGDALLFPPSIQPPSVPSSRPATETIPITLPIALTSSSSSKCSTEEGPFRLSVDPQSPHAVQLSVPSPSRWLSDLQGKNEPDSSAEVESLDAFLTDVDRLQQSGCFADAHANATGADSVTASISVRDLILENIPMRPHESYFNAYDYRLGHSGMDLKPDLRVKIERAYFRPPQAGEQENSPGTFLGLSTVAFEVARHSGEETSFSQSGEIQYSPPSLQSAASEARRDVNLARLPPQRRYRLYFYTYLVAEKHRRVAAIIGAADVAQLESLDNQFRTNPDQTCESVPLPAGVTCIDFDGYVTLSTQLRIEINGQPKFIEWGTRVKDVLPKSQNSRQLKTLRIQRRFGTTEMYDVRFDPKDANILSLVLVGGDRLNSSN